MCTPQYYIIPGQKGKKGPTGEIGNTGPTGEIGNTGPTGEIGNTGEIGEIGNTGPTGEIGNTGPAGTLEFFTSNQLDLCNRSINVLEPLPLNLPNTDIVLHTRGTGALQRTIPDGSPEGGNCRGNYATDLQSARVSATCVSAQDYSVICGGLNNTNNNDNNDKYSAIMTGHNNFNYGSYNTIINGINNLNDKDSSNNNIINGMNNTIDIGLNNNINNGNNNRISGSANNINNGLNNKIIGTFNNINTGTDNFSNGLYNSVINGGSNIIAGAFNSTNGDTNIIQGMHNIIGAGRNNNIKLLVPNVNYCGILSGEGLNLVTDYSYTMGKYNNPGSFSYSDNTTSDRIFMIGYGTGNAIANRKNLMSITADGNCHISGALYTSGGADYAEYYESDTQLKVGTTVSFIMNTMKIRESIDDDIPIGVVSNTASTITNSYSEEWSGKYVKDIHGNYVYEDYEEIKYQNVYKKEIIIKTVEKINYDVNPPEINIIEETAEIDVPEMIEINVYDKNRKIIRTDKINKTDKVVSINRRKKISDKFDPSLKYIPRVERPEWNIVGILGILKVLKGQKVNNNWIKIKEEEIYDTYFVH